MNIFQHFEAEIASILVALKSEGALAADLALPRPAVETVREEAHGDLATNIAMVLARSARTNPKALAGLIADRLAKVASVAAAEVAGPGFINMRIEPAFWPRIVAAALAQPKFGGADLGRGAKVNVEYVSANPTGPLHVGHCRGAVFGDALASLLDFAGYAVTREYYVNDGGAQVDVLARSAFLRYREALGEPIGAIPEGLYPGDYLQPVGEALARAHGRALVGKPEAEWLPVARDAAIEAMMALVRDDLAALSIKHDVFFSERSLSQGAVDKVRVTIEALRASGYVVEGRLPPAARHQFVAARVQQARGRCGENSASLAQRHPLVGEPLGVCRRGHFAEQAVRARPHRDATAVTVAHGEGLQIAGMNAVGVH